MAFSPKFNTWSRLMFPCHFSLLQTASTECCGSSRVTAGETRDSGTWGNHNHISECQSWPACISSRWLHSWLGTVTLPKTETTHWSSVFHTHTHIQLLQTLPDNTTRNCFLCDMEKNWLGNTTPGRRRAYSSFVGRLSKELKFFVWWLSSYS